MSLGVLNNINAIYAENNLNNTSNSLSKVLNQLSSGSKINSGSDDAAGLSLVNGLQANSMALAQSQTNAQEGVGLLQVADGALSQVTSLLNRAVTLATEASNGTLNSSQDTSANNEYQSILSEISNIGSTTTYNGQSVFGSKTNIYTGDSSTSGSSVNALNIQSLSSSNVGDTNGAMSYSNGTNNVFMDLSSSGQNAAVTDTLGTSAQTTVITVNYLAKSSNGSAINASTQVSAGAGTNYSNTAQGLINAINGSGLGITASFGTAAQAGTAATATATAANDTNNALLTGSTDTGIIISGAGVSVSNNSAAAGYSNGVGEVGTLTVSQSTDTLGGTLSVTGADGVNHSITLGTTNSTDTLANLAATINNAGYGITAAVNTTSATTNASGLHASGTLLTFTSASSEATVGGTSITDAQTSYSITAGGVGTSPAAKALGYVANSLTVNNASDTLTGTLDVTSGNNGSGGALSEYNLAGQTLAQVVAYVNANNTTGTGQFADLTASTNTAVVGTQAIGTILTFTENKADSGAAPIIAADPHSAIQGTAASTGTAIVTQTGNAPTTLTITSAATVATTAPAQTLGGLAGIVTAASASDLLVGVISASKSTAGSAAATVTMTGQTINTLFSATNADGSNNATGVANLLALSNAGLTATISGGGTVVTFNENAANAGANLGSLVTIAGGTDNAATLGTIKLTNANDSLTSGTLNIAGTGGVMTAITLGTAGSTDTLTNLMNTINSSATDHTTDGVTATLSADGTSLALSMDPTKVATVPMMYATGATSTFSLTGTPTSAGVASATTLGTLSLPGSTVAGGVVSAASAGDILKGSISIGTETIVLGAAATNSTAGTATMAALAQTINAGNYGVTATLNTANTSMVFKSANSANVNVTPNVTLALDKTDSNTALAWTTPNAGAISSSYYSIGINGNVQDTSTSANTTAALTKGLSADSNGSNGVATISYADAAGISLSATDLSNQTDAQAALTSLNKAITAVAAQDGYIGAQINTLNAVSSVLSTQQENVTSAQNAVQATDYASATSNMSKYEILSQTGISALAQANSMQQEVTKLLQ